MAIRVPGHDGFDYIQKHFAEVVAKYPNEWVAANGKGVIGHDRELADLQAQIDRAGVSKEDYVVHFAKREP